MPPNVTNQRQPEQAYWIETHTHKFGITTYKDIIEESELGWMKGKHIRIIMEWCRDHKLSIRPLCEPDRCSKVVA